VLRDGGGEAGAQGALDARGGTVRAIAAGDSASWTPCASALRAQKTRGAIVDALRALEERCPARVLRDGGGEAGAQGAVEAAAE
jgi:hypothetical protein